MPWLVNWMMAVAEAAPPLRLPPDTRLDAEERLAWERAQIAAHLAGDPTALEALYRAYAGTLYARVLLPHLREPALAEDALADTFTRAHETLDRFRSSDRSVYFWLARIAKNRAIDLCRHSTLRRSAAGEVQLHFEQLKLSEPDPETALSLRAEARFASERVARVLAAIQPRYRRAIELRFFEEQTRENCAQSLEVKLATFDVLLLRALRAFRQAWEKESR